MRKFIANFICAFVPTKQYRHKVRNIAEFGLIRYFIVRMTEPKLRFPHYLSVCAIAKNEGCYFAEWLEYHMLVGVEKFYIYDNESDDDTKKILAPYIKSGIVEYTYWPGEKQQLPVYEDCIARHKFETRWLAVIDLDEFIVPIETKTIPAFMKRFERFSGLEINWLIYGDNGHKTKTNSLVIERFKKHSLPDFNPNRNIKSIINPRFVAHVENHSFPYAIGYSADPDGNKMKYDGFYDTKSPLYDKIRINHYYCKSWEEYSKRNTRGNALTGIGHKYSRRTFNANNKNDILDTTMEKYVEPVKKALSKRRARP